MALKPKDFIEVEFTGRVKDTNEIFDSNIKKDLESIGSKSEAKPFIFSLGQGMFLKGIDDFLLGKPENPAEYKIELAPENSFGPRIQQLVQLMPMKVFTQQKINPIPGVTFNFDGKIGKVISASGGRVRVDFNNPLAGKAVVYDVKVLRKVEDKTEKVDAFINFIFRRNLAFEIKPDKIIIEVEKAMIEFVKLFEEKFKDLFGVGLEVKEAIEKAEKLAEKKVSKKKLKEVKEISEQADAVKE